MKSKTHSRILIRLLLVLILFSYACNLINHLPSVVVANRGDARGDKKNG